MVWFTNMRGVRSRALAAILVAGCGFTVVGGPQAHAADLDYDASRYGSSDDYYGDDDTEWRSRRSSYRQRACTPREFVREELRAEGWRDLRDPRLRGSTVVVEARRAHSGRPFLLTIDRCSGDVIAAEPLGPARRVHLRPFDDDDRGWRRHRSGYGYGEVRRTRDWREDDARRRWADSPRRCRETY